jgi:hypothetical protein
MFQYRSFRFNRAGFGLVGRILPANRFTISTILAMT